MSYEFHKGDLYVEMLDQFHNSHGEYVPATVAELVAALIAEGGETIWWCETHGCQGVTGPSGAGKWCICVNVGLTGETIEDREQEASKQGCRMVEKLLAPLPVESAEAKETP